MEQKVIGIGVCGSIAIYKICDLTSRLKKAGYIVQIIMTPAAQKLVTPLCFQAISGRHALTDQSVSADDGMDHLIGKHNFDIFLLAPATANTIAKIASGIGDNILTTTILSLKCPVYFAPAMNPDMYNNPITQKNIEILKSIGYIEITPEIGKTACMDEGRGRLASVDILYNTIIGRIDEKHS